MVKEENNKAKITLGTTYELNKNLVEKYEEELTIEERELKKQLVEKFLIDKNNRYYMLLCNDRKDYTIISITDMKTKSAEAAFSIVDECLINRGKIKGIDLVSDNSAIEIWLSIDNESYCYYLFPYDNAIVEV